MALWPIGRNVVSWKSKRQNSYVQSSGEAEYRAMASNKWLGGDQTTSSRTIVFWNSANEIVLLLFSRTNQETLRCLQSSVSWHNYRQKIIIIL